MRINMNAADVVAATLAGALVASRHIRSPAEAVSLFRELRAEMDAEGAETAPEGSAAAPAS